MPPSSIHAMHHPRSQIRAAQADAAARALRAGADAPGSAEGTPDQAKGQRERLGFWDLVDVVNPLQHLPVVNRIYRAITGDTIKPAAQVAGSTLLFGPVGFATAAADVALKERTGRDMGGHLMAMLGIGDEGGTAPATQLAGTPAPRPDAQPRPGAPESATPDTASPDAATPDPATLAALRQEELRRMTAVPGGSAAAMAAAGIPAAAAATLPGPGSGGGDAVMAAMMAPQGGGADRPQGMGLSQYRAAALPAGTPPARPMVPPKPVQMADAQRTRATQAALLQAQEQATPPAPSAATAATPPQPPTPGAGVETTSWSQGGTPQLPSALIADLMMSNLSKYEDLSKQRQGR